MKTIVLLFAAILIYPFNNVQQIKDNPDKPLSERAGRIVELKEIKRIVDNTPDYFFKSPHNIQINSEGDVFILDSKQFLSFDSEGEFRFNLFKEGQGPGEMTSISNYQLTSSDVIVHANPPKLMYFSFQGELVHEIPIRTKEWITNFQFYYDGRYYFLKPDWTKLEGHEKIVNVPRILLSLAEDGETLAHLTDFPCRYFFAQKGGERAIIEVDSLNVACLQGRYLVVSHTSDYLLKLFDAESNKLVLTFRRKYPRKKETKQDLANQPSITMGGKTYTKPDKEFQDDIMAIIPNQDLIWIITSLSNPEEGLIVDEFDINGNFLDSFILKFPEGIPEKLYGKPQLAVKNRTLYAVRKGKDHTVYIVKYTMD